LALVEMAAVVVGSIRLVVDSVVIAFVVQ
jgi:hypothetical protein